MTQEVVFEHDIQSQKNVAWWLYIGHAVSFFFSLGLFSFIPLFINYTKRAEALGTFVYSHHIWQIRSFWWYLFWMLAGGVCFTTFIGIPLAMLIWGGAWLWKAYRLIKGWVDLNDNKPMPV